MRSMKLRLGAMMAAVAMGLGTGGCIDAVTEGVTGGLNAAVATVVEAGVTALLSSALPPTDE